MEQESNNDSFVNDIDELIELTELFSPQSQQFLNRASAELKDKDISYQIRTLLHLHERLLYNSTAIYELLKYLKRTSNFHIEHSIGILARNACSDVMLIGYIEYLVEKNRDVETELKKFLGDQVTKTIDNYQSHCDEGAITKSEFEEFADRLVKDYPQLIQRKNNGELKVLFSKYISASTLYKRCKETNNSHLYNGVLHFWDLYSKYEHVGVFSYPLSRRDKQLQIQNLFGVFEYVIVGLYISMSMVTKDAPEKQRMYEVLKLYLREKSKKEQ